MRCLLLALCLFTIVSNAASQQSRDTTKRSQVRFEPLKLVDPINPGIEFVYERQLGRKLSAQLSTTYQRDLFGLSETSNLRGYRVLGALKWFRTPPKTFRMYGALESGYSNVRYRTDAFFFPPGDTGEYGNANYNALYSDTFAVDKRQVFFTARFGFQIAIRRFVLDASLGVGGKIKTTIHSEREHPSHPIDNTNNHPNAYLEANREMYKKWAGTFQPAVSLGYRF